MSDYTDFWKSLDLPADQSQKAVDYNTVLQNADRLNLTDDEQFNLGWGMDATPEEWVKARAKEIQDEINGAKSTEVLKRGLDKGPLSAEELAAKEKEDATTTASEKAAQAIRSNEGGSGGDYSGQPSGFDASTHPDEADAMQAALGTLGVRDALGALVIGPTSIAKTAVDAAKAYNTTIDGLLSDRIAVSENSLRASAAARAAEAAQAAAAAAQQQAADAAQAQAQADAAAGIGPAGMGGGGYDSSGGYSQNSDRADGGWGGGSGGFSTGPGSGGGGDSGGGSSDSGGGTSTGGSGAGSSGGGDSDGGGCVDPAVLVLMADMTSKPAGQLAVGDVLYAMHEINLTFGAYAVSYAAILQQPKLLISFDGKDPILVSASHKFFTPHKTWAKASDLKVGDVVAGLLGSHSILAIDPAGLGDVVKLTVEDAHTYIAAGLISHNKLATGGKVTADRLHGPDPRGPDDGYSALDVGEFVVRQKAAKYYGDDVLQAINEGRIPAEALRRLLKK